ncbi:MAG: acyl-CoA dehydrogenase family protein [Pseudohongiellaceae bacterium]
MNFSYTEEQQMLQESVLKFVQNQYEFDTRNKIIASEDGYSKEYWSLFAELGWLTVPFEEDDGGFGGSAVDMVVMMEEFGKAMLVEPFAATAILAGRVVSELAEGELRAELLGQIMDGSLQISLAHAEAGSRFNVASVQTTATADGDNVVISGTKIAVLNGRAADKLLVVARESGNATDRDGVSVFLVDSSADGIETHSYANVDGKSSSEITFSNVTVPSSARVGAAGNAVSAIESVIDRVTLASAAEALGAMESLLQKTVEYSKTRKQFGTAIGTFQALQHRMSDMFIECQLARSIVVMAAMKMDSGESAAEKAKAVSAAKSRVGKAIHKVGPEAVQIHGGIGTTEELDVGHLFKCVTALEMQYGNTDYHTTRFASL